MPTAASQRLRKESRTVQAAQERLQVREVVVAGQGARVLLLPERMEAARKAANQHVCHRHHLNRPNTTRMNFSGR